jgi:hypothetical protein
MSNTKNTQVQTITAYAAAKLVNAALAEANVLKADGAPKTIPPQMVYTYVRKGYIASVDGLVVVSEFKVWLGEYLARQTKAPQDVEQAEFDQAEAI